MLSTNKYNINEVISLTAIDKVMCERHDFYHKGKLIGVFHKALGLDIVDTFEYIERNSNENNKCSYCRNRHSLSSRSNIRKWGTVNCFKCKQNIRWR